MIGGSKIVKITAKTALSGNMLKAIIVSAVFLFCCFICNYSAGIFSYTGYYVISDIIYILMSIFILTPLFLGLLRYIWRMLFSVYDNPVSVFYYISEKSLYKRALKFIFNIMFKAVPVGILLYFPNILLWFFSKDFFYEMLDLTMPLWVANINQLLIILNLVAGVILIFYMLKFYLAPILFIADEEMAVEETLHMSAVISRKSSLDFIYLATSFIGWILLSVLVIPLIFTLPYLLSSYAVHVRFAIAEYNKHISLKNEMGNNLWNVTV